MKTQSLPIELPRIDADTQNRLKINDDTVSDYADLIEASGTTWPFPPIDVFHDGTDHYVADGFHRILGAIRTKRGSIPCIVHKGTARDAKIFGMTANDRHGLRMTRADKRACIEWLLDNGGKMTQKVIAEAVGVVVRTVATVAADRKYEVNPPADEPNENMQVASPPEGGDDQPADEPIEADSEPINDPLDFPDIDYGKCPNCASEKWDAEDPDEVVCKECLHPHGEPAGDVDEDETPDEPVEAVAPPESAGTRLRSRLLCVIEDWREECPDATPSLAASVLGNLAAEQ